MSTSATSALSSAYGTIDVNTMVSQLMQVERNPKVLLQNRQLKVSTKASALESLAADVAAVKTAASLMDAASEWEPLKTSSSSSAVTTSATSGAITGSLQFKVLGLAANQKLYSSSTLSSTSSSVTSASRFLLAAGLGNMGFSTVASDATLGLGSHTVNVTQASAAAAKTGDSPLSLPLIVTGANNDIDIVVNGQSYTLSLADGTYSGPNSVADAVNAAISALGGGAPDAVASVDENGALVLSTTNEGSAASIQVTGGSAAADLGLSVDAVAHTGTDGKVTVDGTETVITNVAAGGTVNLAAPAGSITATLAGGLRTGASTVRNIDLGDGSLGAVVNAINSAGGSVAASAVRVGEGSYRMQIESRATGVGGRLNVDLSVFDDIPGFSTLSAGTDASIEVQGTDPYTVTSSSNTFSDVLPGVSFSVNSATSETVTISATRDADALATRVQTMVQMLNQTFADIKVKTAYNAASKTAGALSGDSTIRNLQSQLTTALTGLVGSSSVSLASSAGITLKKDGTLEFDAAKFKTAFEADPAGVQRLFFSATDDPDPGITQRLATVAKAAADSVDGYLTTSAKQNRTTADGIGKQIDAFEVRMKIKETALKAQWNAINVALERFQQQSASLSQQLASMSANSGTTSSSSS